MLDDVRVVRDDPRDQHLPLGQLHVLPDAPLVLVPRVRLLHQVVARLHPQHEVDQVGERRVEGVRAVPAAEADVIADPLLGDAPERVVEGLDPQLRPAPVVGDRAAEREDRVVLVHEHRVVDLEQEARLDDAPVLLVERVGDREDELLLARVVLVAQPVDARRSHDREECVGHLDASERALEAGDVALERGGVVLDRPGAEPEPSLGLDLGRARPLLALDAHLVLDLAGERGVVLGVELREGLPVAARRQDVAALERHHPPLEPADALVEVGDPGGLAHLAVVDDVDSRPRLAPHHVVDGVGERLLVRRLVDGLAARLGREEVQQGAWTREAAGVRGQDPVHQSSSGVGVRTAGARFLRFAIRRL